MTRVVFLLLSVVLLAGCREVEGTVWSEFRSVSAEGLNPEQPIVFSPEIVADDDTPLLPDRLQTGENLRITLHVRYSKRHALNAFRVAVSGEGENGKIFTDTVEVRTRDKNGNATVEASHGLCEWHHALSRPVTVPAGWLDLSVQSLSPQSDTRGVGSIGLSLETASTKGNAPAN